MTCRNVARRLQGAASRLEGSLRLVTSRAIEARAVTAGVENYWPGGLEKLGLGYAALATRNPGLVYCSVSAYGHTGPDSAQAGFGLIAEAKSAAMAMVGVRGEAAPLFRIALAEMSTGIHGVAAVCAALFGRVQSGRGQHIDMALYGCMVSMHDNAVQCYTLSDGREIPAQTGHDLPNSTLYGVFAGRDGYFVIAAQVDDSWKRLAKPVGGNAVAKDCLAYDLVYGKGLSPFLRFAREGGAGRLADGVGMLVEQVAEAFAWWRGVWPKTRAVVALLTVPLA